MPDYVVVGAGAAGCVLAGRLSESPSTSVTVLEAGGTHKKLFVTVPPAFSKLFKTDVDWAYFTEPEPELGNRALYWPRGKLIGGCGSMNAMHRLCRIGPAWHPPRPRRAGGKRPPKPPIRAGPGPQVEAKQLPILAPVAQRIEQRFPKPKVARSTRVGGADDFARLFVIDENGRGPTWTELLTAIERGDAVEARALSVQLAHEVLASRPVALATRVLAGGSHATTSAIELAELLADAFSPREKRAAPPERSGR